MQMIEGFAARVVACATLVLSTGATAAPMPAEKAAALFGARPLVEQISLSPDGTKVAYVSPMAGKANAILVAAPRGDAKVVARADGAPFRLSGCNWSADDRLVCRQYGLIEGIPFTRMTALDSDGGNQKMLGRRATGEQVRMSQFDGSVIDWMSGSDGTVLMARDFVPEMTTGSHIASDRSGLGVERVDTRTLRTVRVEPPRAASAFIADGRGDVRLMVMERRTDVGMLTGRTTYLYREAGGRSGWKTLVENDTANTGWQPIAVDAGLNKAYALHKLDGRFALYRISLDGLATKELVYANPEVDVDDVVQVGRSARVVGASFITDRRQTVFFDPTYEKLAKSLAKAVPGLPLVNFIGASADENVVLLRAGSDVDPGRYYVLDRARRDMWEILHERPGLDGETLAPVRSVRYRAADGTMVPAYLTLPVGGATKGLPAIVMPHGGPASRDEWGFDWLAQFYAARGYAVLQPNFRGSTGYGDQWFVDNGFRSWRTAIGDVTAAGRWLLSEGIAAPGKLAIVGWSYGGYAALQSAVVDPGLFKAVVAIAPVTDLAMLKRESEGFVNARIMQAYIGTGPHIVEGSPLRHAAAIKAPVLLFHGDRDINVDIRESREMDQALRAAGAKTELVTYKTLDHQLNDGAARTDMLTRSDAFLRAVLQP